MTPAEIIQRFQDDYDEILTLDGFNDALLGIVVGAYLGELTPLFVHIWRDNGDLLQVR